MRKTPILPVNQKQLQDSPSKPVIVNSEIHHLAFDNSLQANIISIVSTGKIITANDAACKLLGYTQEELLSQTLSSFFDINDPNFKNMMMQRRIEKQSKGPGTMITKSGRFLTCDVTTAIFVDEKGIECSIITIVDISEKILEQKNIDFQKEKVVAEDIVTALEKSAAMLAKNNEWIKHIAKTSYDVMWDWNVATGHIYVSDSVEEIFGYKVVDNTITYTDFIKNLLPEEKDNVDKKILRMLASDTKSWKDTFMVRCRDGSVVATTARAIIIRDEQQQAIRLIGAIQDVTRLHELKTKWEHQVNPQNETSEMAYVANGLSIDIIWDWNLLTDEVHIGEDFEELFGYAIQNNKVSIATWCNYFYPEDRDAVKKELYEAINSTAAHWAQVYRFSRADGSIATVLGRGSIMRHPDGKAYRMIGSMQDLSKQKILEEKLEKEIRLKEKQIEIAMEDAKETERADIGKELHDNVNQLLGTSRLYLSMAKEGGEEGELYLNRSSEYMLTAIQEIRKLTKILTTDTFKNLGLVEAIQDIVQDTMEVNIMKISCSTESFIEDGVNDRFKLNVFRIVQEQLNNIQKHAAATNVAISLLQDKTSILLSITDNGIGFDTAKKCNGIGITNIKSRADFYNGIVNFVSQPGQGCVLTVVFPIKKCLIE